MLPQEISFLAGSFPTGSPSPDPPPELPPVVSVQAVRAQAASISASSKDKSFFILYVLSCK